MGFWIFMLLFSLLIPSIMFFVGVAFKRSAPKEINYVFGYRTNMSMKNKDTWEFAHTYCGRLWKITGISMVPLSIIPLLFVIEKTKDTIGTVGSIIIFIQLSLLVLSIVPVELALKNAFDKDGNRK